MSQMGSHTAVGVVLGIHTLSRTRELVWKPTSPPNLYIPLGYDAPFRHNAFLNELHLRHTGPGAIGAKKTLIAPDVNARQKM